ncbi:MAG TPA: DUF1585 domain-containing protein [Kofleriaceae bacterium]|jgi:hypothetical protein
MLRSILLVLVIAAVARPSGAARSLPDYRYFRALSIDLQGRPPTRDELAAFEQPGFDLDAWIDTHLTGEAYAERLRRIYLDLLRLEIGPSFQFVPNPLELRRIEIENADGGHEYVYFRRGQRRVDPAIDGDVCLTQDDTGQQFPPNAAATGTAHPVPRAVLDARTVLVKPWWLYADYRAPVPSDRVGADWAQRFPGYAPVPALLVEPDGKPTTAVRVCREEAQTTETGTVYASGRPAPKKGDPLPGGRLTQPPGDTGFARALRGRAVSCLSGTGFANSIECGCGIGLERCLPATTTQNESAAFLVPQRVPLGVGAPFEATPQPAAAWERLWWGEEAKRFLDRIFLDDRDFREVLTSRATLVNGPLAQFYRFFAGATCCGQGSDLGYADPVPLVEPGAIPDALVPADTATWLAVADRGPHAAGILTMPVFLTKYGSRRARAHVAYSAFLCKDFVADSVKLEPSTEPDLTKRPGCSACHQTLEPMASYFTRVMESDWTYLPAERFPVRSPLCDRAKPPGACKTLYDPAFSEIRGAYASPQHAEAGPGGLAEALVAAPEFAPCVAQNVASAFLGRALGPEDDEWRDALAREFAAGGYKMRSLVRAIVKSPRYKTANDSRRQ